MDYEIDGMRFSTLEEFFAEISHVLVPNVEPELGCVQRCFERWFRYTTGRLHYPLEHKIYKERLGYPETGRQLELRQRCHPDSREKVLRDLETVRQQAGSTVFDWLVEIIRIHSKGGREESDGVRLFLD